MKSPFPGMDPYLEHRWNDVHTRLCAYLSRALQPNLPRGLRARAQDDIVLEDAGNSMHRQRFEADTSVIEVMQYDTTSERHGSVATVEPVVIRQIPVLVRNRWVEILDTTDSDRVVTVVEILSPGNKLSGKLNKRYRQKVNRYLEAGVSVVEIDLLRSSRLRLELTLLDLPENRRAQYYTCVNWASDPFEWKVYPMPLRAPLPTIPIPCRETDSDVPLALQPLIDQIYLDGGHDDIRYDRPAKPPLSESDAAWAAGLIAVARPS